MEFRKDLVFHEFMASSMLRLQVKDSVSERACVDVGLICPRAACNVGDMTLLLAALLSSRSCNSNCVTSFNNIPPKDAACEEAGAHDVI
jgi:hypothetical protein